MTKACYFLQTFPETPLPASEENCNVSLVLFLRIIFATRFLANHLKEHYATGLEKGVKETITYSIVEKLVDRGQIVNKIDDVSVFTNWR